MNPANAEAQRWQYVDDNRPTRQGARGRTRAPQPQSIMMLNADICLVKNINPDANTGE